MLDVVLYQPAGQPAKRAIYCVAPQITKWAPDHLAATVPWAAPRETPVLIGDVPVSEMPAWLAAVVSTPAITGPWGIWIHPNVIATGIPAELLVHELVHYLRQLKLMGDASYLATFAWQAVTRLSLHFHDTHEMEVEARNTAMRICAAYAIGQSTTVALDAPAAIAASFPDARV